MSHIIVYDRPVELPGAVQSVLPDQHGLRFRLWLHTARRRVQPDRIVLHWTGGEGDGPQVYRVLRNRGLSIHFVIDPMGVVWEYCDPASIACRHAGWRENARSVGIEVSCYGFRRWAWRVPRAGRDRDTYQAMVHGHVREVADFRPEQHEAVWSLCSALCDALSIPRRVYVQPQRVIPWRQREVTGGVLGHYHISSRKLDPGTRPLEALRDRWAK